MICIMQRRQKGPSPWPQRISLVKSWDVRILAIISAIPSLTYPPPLLLRSTKGFGLPPQVAGLDQLIKYGVAMALSRGCEGGV